MKNSSRQKPDDSKQAAAFRKAAREAGADASDEGFKNVLRTVAKAKPEPQLKKAKRR